MNMWANQRKNHGHAPDKYVRREFDPIRTSFVGKLLYDKMGSKVTNLGIQNLFVTNLGIQNVFV